jgi:hypothetical protein
VTKLNCLQVESLSVKPYNLDKYLNEWGEMKKNSNKSSINLAFLVIGLIILAIGYNIISSLNSVTSTSASKWWGFGATLFGGLILGKWLSDYYINKK